ncbi:MAG: carbon-nitrogen hydrolase family protein [Haloarculaceae archaeon]
MSREVTLGAAQLAEVYLDYEETIEKDCEYIRRAGNRGIDLLVFPEYHVPGAPTWFEYDGEYTRKEYYTKLYENSVTVPGPSVDRLCTAAADAETAVVIGVNEVPDGSSGTMYNTLVFIDSDGTLLGKRRKLVPTNYERLFHGRGSGEDVRVFESSVGTVGGLLCGEHTNHLAGFATLALGEEIHAAAWPTFPERDEETRESRVGIRTRFHASSGKVPTVAATGVVTPELAEAIDHPGIEPGGGASSIIGPGGEYLAGPVYDGEQLVTATVDMADRVPNQAVHDVLGHYNRFDIFQLVVDETPDQPLQFAGDADDR